MGKVLKNESRVFRRVFYLPVLTGLIFLSLNVYLFRQYWYVSQKGKLSLCPVELTANHNQGFGLFCFLGFLVLSYLFFSKCREAGMEETAEFGEGAKTLILLSKTTLLTAFTALLCINLFIYDLIWYFGANYSTTFLQQELRGLVLHYFLPLMVAILLGGVVALKLNRLAGAAVILLLAFVISPAFDLFTAGLTETVGLIRWKNLITLYMQGGQWRPDSWYGAPGEGFRLFLCLFWIALLSLFLLWWALRGRVSRLVASLCCVAVAAATFPTAFQRTGSLNKYSTDLVDRNTYGYLPLSYQFNMQQQNTPADFSVERCRLDIHIGLEMKGKATMRVAEEREWLDFTLIHSYRVDSVQDGEGTALEYRREGDYLSVHALKAQEIEICYTGSDVNYYSNDVACFLPGDFAYYPMAGLLPTYDNQANNFYTSMLPGTEAEFEISVEAPYPVTVSLPKVGEGYKGTAQSFSIVGGPYAVQEEKSGLKIVRSDSQRAPSLSREKIEEAFEKIGKEAGISVETLPDNYFFILLPDSPVLSRAPFAVFKNHAVIGSDVDSEKFALLYTCAAHDMSPAKVPLLEYVIETPASYISGIPENTRMDRFCLSTKNRVFGDLMSRAFEKDGAEATYQSIYQYLVNPEDTRDPKQFLEDISGFGEAVKASEDVISQL